MTPTILIGGATGATGSVAVKLLLGKGFPVRAFVHTDDERARELQEAYGDRFAPSALLVEKAEQGEKFSD